MKIILFSPSQSVSAAKELFSSGVPCNRFLTSNSNSAYYLEEKLTGAPWKYGDKRNLKNMDETFQKRNNLRVKKEEWKRNCCTTQEFEKDIQTWLIIAKFCSFFLYVCVCVFYTESNILGVVLGILSTIILIILISVIVFVVIKNCRKYKTSESSFLLHDNLTLYFYITVFIEHCYINHLVVLSFVLVFII